MVPGFHVHHIANVHGAGDALAGGCIAGLIQKMSVQRALAYGVASSVAALRSQGSRITKHMLYDDQRYNVHDLFAKTIANSYTVSIKV